MSVREALERYWFALGGADAYTVDARSHAERFFSLLDTLGPEAVDLHRVDDELAALFADDERVAAIEVLTIHKAKGLEFDHVVVPFLDKGTRGDDVPLLSWRMHGKHLLMSVAGQALHTWLQREERKRARNELVRLLYVACTRARRSLLLCASGSTTPQNSLAYLLKDEFVDAAAVDASKVEQAELFTDQSLERLVDGYEWWPPELRSIARAPQSPELAHSDPHSVFDVAVGELVHQTLVTLAERPLPADAHAYCVDQMDRWREDARSRGIDSADHAVELVREHIVRVLADPTGRWILEQRTDAVSEMPLNGIDEGQLVRCRVDRTFVDEEGVRWVIDYKSGSPHQSRERLVESQLARYRPQMERYGRLMSALFGEPVRLALYLTAIPELVTL